MAGRSRNAPASRSAELSPQTNFQATGSQRSLMTSNGAASPPEDLRAISTRRKAFIALVLALAIAAVITVIVVLVESDDDSSDSESSTVTTTNSINLPHVAVTNATMVSATSEDDSKDRCVELEWIPTGVEWMASSGSSISYLCMQQSVKTATNEEDVGAVDLNAVSVMRRVVVVSNADGCPSTMQTVINPSTNVFMCAEFVSASTAFETQEYVVDLMTTTELFYNHDTPGWITWPIDLKMESSASSVFLSAQYPVRPIVGLQVLAGVTTDTVYSACGALQPQGEWETPGFVLKSSEGAASNSDTSDAIVCVHRPLANATGSLSVLTDVSVVLPTESCPGTTEDANSTEITSEEIKLCAEWGLVDFGNTRANATTSPSSQATSSFVAELSLFEVAEDEAAAFNISLSVPGNWDVVGNETTGSVRTFFLARKYEPFVLNTTTDSSDSSDVDENDEVSSSVEAVASNSTEELSFRVLQIADMHLTGNPDYPCSSGPTGTIRASLLAAASVIADQLREESNASSSASAGEANDPLYNECREALTVAFLDELLDIEQPDFVVFTGDNVQTDLDTTMHAFAMSIFTARVESRGIPWAAVFGNHDTEGGLTREEMLDLMTQGKQYSHVKKGPRDIGGVGNYEVNVVAPADGPWGQQGSTVFRMYFLDSHSSIDTATYPLVSNANTYDWIKETQVEFYRELALSHATEGISRSSSDASNGSVPAVMYYHIPVPEYALASPLNRLGDKNEATASSAVNSGLFSALVEVGDVKATFVGHDHINEYCYLRQGVQLCYGGGIGLGRAYGLSDFARRARVLEWTFNTNQTRTLRSWKRHFAEPTQIQSLEVLFTG